LIPPERHGYYVLVNEFQERRNIERGFGLRPFHRLAV
jgi:hypothetical protein